MFRKLMIAGASLAMLAAATPSIAAAPCRDAHGKFMKCPTKPAAKPMATKPAAAAPVAAKPMAAKPAPAKATHCKDAKGKFVKCGTAGAKPA
ncbi:MULTISPECIES: hypothetical protein [unclassified Sphingomonas]|uniref:hypothetical protein n=1 Tax=Sphingomonas TaxID=13687 RepID=UPI001AC61C8A|nr:MULTISPECIES: hypothetical protein [unclassified Sphingomonas]MBN8812116.1 hypothetical protein [Sphingomonas sp.]